MNKNSLGNLLTLAFYFPFLISIAFSYQVESDDECAKKFVIDTNWLKSSSDGCLVACLASQKLGMANFSCDYSPNCNDFCKKAKEDTKNTPTCEEITNPSILIKTWKVPKWPPNIRRARSMADEAIRKTQQLFPKYDKGSKKCHTWHNGIGDAFRHCYWSCLMTKKFGESKAMDYADTHEFTDPNKCEEAKMDYHNNHEGASVAKSGQDCEIGCKENNSLIILEDGETCH